MISVLFNFFCGLPRNLKLGIICDVPDKKIIENYEENLIICYVTTQRFTVPCETLKSLFRDLYYLIIIVIYKGKWITSGIVCGDNWRVNFLDF